MMGRKKAGSGERKNRGQSHGLKQTLFFRFGGLCWFGFFGMVFGASLSCARGGTVQGSFVARIFHGANLANREMVSQSMGLPLTSTLGPKI